MNDSNSSSPIVRPQRLAWNKGKLTGPKPPLRSGHVWSIRAKLQLERRPRDLTLSWAELPLNAVGQHTREGLRSPQSLLLSSTIASHA